MVEFEEPKDEIERDPGWETTAETAVNTAVPSRAPSTFGKETGEDVENGMDIKKRLTQAGTVLACVDPVTHIVSWDGPDDEENPANFKRSKKWRITMVTAVITFCVSFASSVFSTATATTAVQFGVSLEVMILGVSLYVLGFACGPLVWGPLSECYGRTRPLFIGFTLFAIFQIPLAVAQNVETIMLARFFGGCFGAAPIAIVGGLYVDIWDNSIDRGIATAAFAGSTFLGPVVGPLGGSFITESHLGWRWTAWITLIMSAFFGIIGLFTIPETFVPVLLKRKAERLRHETKNWAIHSEIDEVPISIRSLSEKYFSKPWIMLFQEPILMAMTLYSSLVYSILYLIFFAYPYTFQQIRQWDAGIASLPFLGILIGIFLCCIYLAFDTKTRFQRLLVRSGKFVIPEARLPPMIAGSLLLPIGLFWFAWTSNPNVSWVPQVISGVFIGCGIFLVFLPSQIYIVDTYLLNANSALSATACARALMAAGFPLFAEQMYQNLGAEWATSLLGFLCVGMIPFPILFWLHGEKLRAKGKFAFVL